MTHLSSLHTTRSVTSDKMEIKRHIVVRTYVEFVMFTYALLYLNKNNARYQIYK